MLYGRDAERERLGALLEGMRAGRSGVLVLRGDPEVGKSVLLAELADRAGDMQVLPAQPGSRPSPSSRSPALDQLVWPLLDTLDEIPARQAEACAARSVSTRRPGTTAS